MNTIPTTKYYYELKSLEKRLSDLNLEYSKNFDSNIEKKIVQVEKQIEVIWNRLQKEEQ